jgi:hypothetical protein
MLFAGELPPPYAKQKVSGYHSYRCCTACKYRLLLGEETPGIVGRPCLVWSGGEKLFNRQQLAITARHSAVVVMAGRLQRNAWTGGIRHYHQPRVKPSCFTFSTSSTSR